MNNNNRNTRTLIVSFVVAVMVMIPLRFIEYGNQVGKMADFSQPVVLGEYVEQSEDVEPEVVLEYPYNELEEGGGCLTQADFEVLAGELVESGRAEEIKSYVDLLCE